MPFDSWDAYFYPGTATLRNRFDELDPEVLHAKEYHRATLREFQLRTGNATVPRTYDAAHLQGIHRHLFQDVYDWAGEYRTVNMRKPDRRRGFADVGAGEIDRYLEDVSRIVHAADWPELDRDQFAVAIADAYAHLNQAHPFREGNGRSAKLFLEHVAEQSRFTLAYDQVPKDAWNAAAEFSRPDIGSYKVFPESVIPVFRQITVDRPVAPKPPTLQHDAPRDRTLRGAERYRGGRELGGREPGPRGLER